MRELPDEISRLEQEIRAGKFVRDSDAELARLLKSLNDPVNNHNKATNEVTGVDEEGS